MIEPEPERVSDYETYLLFSILLPTMPGIICVWVTLGEHDINDKLELSCYA